MIDDLNFERIAPLEPKTQAPLFADANTPLPLTIANQLPQIIGGWQPQVLHIARSVQLQQVLAGAGANIAWQISRLASGKEAFCPGIGEGDMSTSRIVLITALAFLVTLGIVVFIFR
jgi:hypothetical protein